MMSSTAWGSRVLSPTTLHLVFDIVTPTFYKNKNFVQIGVHIKMHIKL
jgi:hypothetical protein